MSTTTKRAHDRREGNSGETRIRVPGVGYQVYQTLIEAAPARTAIRMAYDGRDLEIMVKGPVHENFARLLDRFVMAVASELGIRLEGLGETTWKRPEIERGLEADQCYFVAPDKIAIVNAALARKSNDVADYPNPDMAIEVDVSPSQVDRPGIYAALGVQEVWQFDGETVSIHWLDSGPRQDAGEGRYFDAGQSRWLPVYASEATRWLVEEDSRDKAAWEARVRAWAREEPAGRLEGGKS